MRVGIIYSKNNGHWRQIIKKDGDFSPNLLHLHEHEAFLEISEEEYEATAFDGAIPSGQKINKLIERKTGVVTKPNRYVLHDDDGEVKAVIKGDVLIDGAEWKKRTKLKHIAEESKARIGHKKDPLDGKFKKPVIDEFGVEVLI